MDKEKNKFLSSRVWPFFFITVALLLGIRAGIEFGDISGTNSTLRKAVANNAAYFHPKTGLIVWGQPDGIAVSGLMPEVTYRDIPQVKPKVK